MAPSLDDQAAAAARDFAATLAPRWQALLGDALLGVYLLGSLAHGGFSRRYSDIDVAVVTEDGLTPADFDAMRADAGALSSELAAKLSIFWTDRTFSAGRFPPLDRADYLDHGVALFERERVTPPRPGLAEVRALSHRQAVRGLVAGRGAVRRARRARAEIAQAVSARASLSRALRLQLHDRAAWDRTMTRWSGSRIARCRGSTSRSIARALDIRRAAADPDALFAARGAPAAAGRGLRRADGRERSRAAVTIRRMRFR